MSTNVDKVRGQLDVVHKVKHKIYMLERELKKEQAELKIAIMNAMSNPEDGWLDALKIDHARLTAQLDKHII